MDTGKMKAFVIGPIGDSDAEEGSPAKSSFEDAIETFEKIIQPACSALDIEAFRADHINRSGDIHDQIYRNLRDSHIVIADLTGANPNVMYELGLRHTTGKLTFQIGERDRLPFDISTIRTILFKRTASGLVSAKRSLIAAIAEGLEQGADLVAATRVWFEISHNGEEDQPSNDEVEPFELAGSLDDEPGFLEQIADTESSSAEIGSTLLRAAAILEEITSVLDEGTQRIIDLPATPNHSTLKLQEANNIARNLETPAIKLKMAAKDLKNHVDLAIPGMEYMLSELAHSDPQPDGATEFIQSLRDMVDSAESSISSSESFAATLDIAGNATRLMRRVSGSIKSSTLSIAESSRRIASLRSFI
jgi:hypothetical protein